MKIISFEQKYTKELWKMMQLLRDYIVSLEFWDDDMIQTDISKNVAPTVESFLKGELFIFLALGNSEICGFVLGRVKNNEDEGSQIKKVGWIWQLYVYPKHQKKWIGKKLLERIEQEFAKNGATHTIISVFAANFNALWFYKKYGFEKRLITLGKKNNFYKK